MILPHQLDPEPVLSHVCFVAQHCDRLVQMADDEIRPASVVQIRQREAAADVLAAEVGTALQSNVAKLAVALVAQQNGALAQAGFGGKPNDVAVADRKSGG